VVAENKAKNCSELGFRSLR